ncbi:MAG: PAS domain S-box protein [Planctomycetes bacterium]|nr:PAS domain S-box protein [Planctomycetota bacterium]
MKDFEKTAQELLFENEELRTRLEEAREALQAIRRGHVDAVVVSGPEGEQVFSLHSTERTYRVLIEEMNEGALTLNTRGMILYCNRGFSDLVRYPLEHLIGSSVYAFPCPDDRAILDALLREGARRAVKGEIRFQVAGEGPVPVHLSVNPFQPEGIPLLCLLVTDLTEQKRREVILAAEKLARSILEQAAEAIVVCDQDTRILQANPVACRLCSENPLLHPFDAMFPLQLASGRPFDLTLILGGQVLRALEVLFRRDDSPLFLLSGDPLFHDPGGLFGCIITLTDITERKRTEEALRESHLRLGQALKELKTTQQQVIQQERLRALGQMAGGIAHDVNNALSPILGYSELLLARPEGPQDMPRVRRYLEVINTAAQDATKVVARLREFYRPREAREIFQFLHLRPLVEKTIFLTRPRWHDQALASGQTIQFLTDVPKGVGILGNETEIREVLINLIFNAVDAMPAGGTIRITGRLEGQLPENFGPESVQPSPPPGAAHPPRSVILEISDTGTGMTEAVRQHCLEPFFTTKKEKGTGLGLAVVYGIIRRHEGIIDIRSEIGKGTIFTFRFPAPAETHPSEKHQEVMPLPRPLHVLVVEVEPEIRQMLTEYLKQDGHTFETAAHAQEALEKLAAGRFDLVLTGRAMPEMSGDQLASRVKTVMPGTPVILLTGFGDTMKAMGEVPEGVDLVLSKPPTLSQFREAMAGIVTVQPPRDAGRGNDR